MKIKHIIIISFFFILNACSSDCINLDIDVNNINIELKTERMEKVLFDRNQKNIFDKHRLLLNKYYNLYSLFFSRMINEGNPRDKDAHLKLSPFLSDSSILLTYNNIDTQFKDFKSYTKKLESAFKHYKYYFPDSSLPIITTFYSNFNATVIELDSRLCVGLDMYLGADNEIVKMLSPRALPQFIKDKMDSKYLVSDIMFGFLFNRYSQKLGDDFLSEIISQGKTLYLLNAMMPDEEEYIKIKYTADELLWCKENESNIWQTIINQEILYTKDIKTINNFIGDAPSTKGLPDESPSRVGSWLGYKIVTDFANKNCSSLEELINEKNVRKILKSYNPK